MLSTVAIQEKNIRTDISDTDYDITEFQQCTQQKCVVVLTQLGYLNCSVGNLKDSSLCFSSIAV